MTVLGFVRHGITDWNFQERVQGQTDVPLNATGRKQAKAIAARLSNEQWDLIYSSDLSRAKETAVTIAAALGLPVIEDQRLREMHCGEIEGTTEADRIARWGTGWKKSERDLKIEDNESIIGRGMSFVQEIANKHPQQRILVVSHGALIGLTLTRLIPHEDTEEHLKNTSLTKLRLLGESWKCELFNCIMHLQEA